MFCSLLNSKILSDQNEPYVANGYVYNMYVSNEQDCSKPFGSSRYFEGADGRPYCEAHIRVKGRAAQCYTCNGPILGRIVNAMNRRFHPEHFVCSFCRRELVRTAFKELDGRPYCQACFGRLSGRWCHCAENVRRLCSGMVSWSQSVIVPPSSAARSQSKPVFNGICLNALESVFFYATQVFHRPRK